MKVVILAGGHGTRISEESHLKPKPMIEIGGQPILWHIMKIFSHYGFNDFIICAGYMQHVIKEFFANYFLYQSDITFDFTACGVMTIHNNVSEPWKVTIVNTGLNTLTGGRIKRVRPYLGEETFLMTYGDGVSDVRIDKIVECHKSHGNLATLTAVQPEGRFGFLDMEEDHILSFREKHIMDSGWINGGFMALEPSVCDFIDGDNISFEREPLELLAKRKQLIAYKHAGFWQCMDTLRDKEALEKIWASGHAPWKVW